MNFKNLFKLSTLVAILTLVLSSISFAASTYYVDATNGLNSNDGMAATQTDVGVGPVDNLTTLLGLYTLVDGDVINIAVGTYGDLIAVLTFTNSITINGYIPVGSASTEVVFSNGLGVNAAGKTVTLTLNGIGVDGPSPATRINVGTAFNLAAGTVSINSTGALYLASGITITRTSGTLTGSPAFGTDINLTYASPGSNGTMTAGPEVPASFGAGILTSNRLQYENLIISAPSTLTFALNTGAAAIVVAQPGDVTFNTNIALTKNSIINNTSSGNLTINGSVTYPDPGTNGVTPARIAYSGTGSMTINGDVTFNYRDQNGGVAIASTGGGALEINGNVSFVKTGAGAADVTASIAETAGGSLDINGTVTHTPATISGTAYYVNVSLVNSSAGSMSVGSSAGTSTVRGTLSNVNVNSTFSLSGNLDLTASLGGATTGLNNTGDIAIGGYTLNLAFVINTQTLTITNSGEIAGTGLLKYSVTNGTGAGTVNFTGSGDFGNYTVASSHAHTFTGSPTFNAVSLPQGSLTLAAGQTATVEGAFSQSGGTLVTAGAAAVFDFKGGFSRTSGTYTYNTGAFKFSGSANQTFSPGANLTLYDLEFASTGSGVVTLGQSVVVNHNLTFSSGSMNLSNYNIQMKTGAPNVVLNNAEYTSSGGGAIIFAGASGSIGGTGVFSNFEVNLTAANEVTCTSDITVSGVVTLRNGNLEYNSTVANESITFDNSIVKPTIRVNTNPTFASTIADGLGGTGTVTVATDETYNVTYFGDLGATYTISGAEWIPAQLFDVNIQTTSGTTVQIPASAVTVKGSVYVAGGESFDLNAQTLTASGSVTHSIFGTVANGAFKITGNTVTIDGDDDSVPGENVLDDLEINPTTAAGSNIQVTNIYSITGDVTMVKGNATLTLGSADDDADDVTNKKIVGALSVAGGTLNLGSWIEVGSGGANAFTHTAGIIALGDNSLVYAPGGAATYSLTGSGSYTYASTDGRVVFSGNNASLTTNPSSTGGVLSIPNVEIDGNVTVSGNSQISNVLFHTSGILNIAAGQTLNFSGTDWYEYGTGDVSSGVGTGNLTFTSTADLSTNDYSIKNWTVNAGSDSGAAVTVKSISGASLASSTTPRTVTVTGTLTLTSGDLALGMNDVATVNLSRSSGTVSGNAGSASASANTLGEGRGEVLMGGGTLTPGSGFVIPNFRLTGNTTVAGSNNFTVSGFFQFGQFSLTLGANNKIALGDGATIIRDGVGTISKAPVFDGAVNYLYTNTVTAGVELPASASNITNFAVNSNATVSGIAGSAVGTGVVTLTTSPSNKTIVVNGKLSVLDGELSLSSGSSITMADSATVEMGPTGKFNVTSTTALPNGTNSRFIYDGAVNLLYSSYPGAAAATFSTTSVEWPSTATVAGVTVTVGDANASTNLKVQLHQSRTTGALTVATATSGSKLYVGDDNVGAFGPLTLTVTGNMTISKGDITTEADASTTSRSTLKLLGNLTMSGGSIGATETGLNLEFAGAVDQAVTLSSAQTINNVVLNQSTTAKVIVGGANLTINGTLDFRNGLLEVTSPNTLIMAGTYSRSNLTGTSHVVGNLRRTIAAAAGRYEYPVGSETRYRPFVIQFNTAPISAATLTVKHVDQSPLGTKGFPIDGGTIKIGSYPDYYWLVQSNQSLGASVSYDVELTGADFAARFTNVDDMRIIRRFDGDVAVNSWLLQGANANYSNILEDPTDTTVTVRNRLATGGIVTQAALYTIGLPTLAPTFSAPTSLIYSVAENDTLDIQVVADPEDVGETIEYSLVGAPSWASINATTGLLRLLPDHAAGSTTAYSIVVRATDSGDTSSDLTLSITVVDANRAPAFSTAPAEGTIKYGSTLTLTYVAADADADAVTYSVTSVPAPSVAPTITAALGVVTFTPAFADAGNSFVFEVVAADGKGGADTASTVVTVQYSKEKGDVNLDGSITSADATPILKYVVGSATLTDEQQYYAKVNSDDQIGSLDAAWVLYYAVNGSFPTAKVAPAIASTEFGQLSKVAANSTEGLQVNNGEFTLPVSFKQTTGVVSVYAEFQLSGAIDFESVTPRLPEGWLYASSFENGVLKIAMAGVNPLSDGNIANINVKMMDKEATGTIQGFTKLNDNVVNNLNAIKVKEIPAQFALSQNYPNPFNPTTSIKFQLPENANVTLEIYNMLGQRVKSLINGQQESGYYTVNWDGTNDFGSRVSSGIYIYRISAGKFVSTLKMNLLK